MSMIQFATQVATIAHEGQSRKFTGEAYIGHPVSVAGRVERFLDGFTEESIGFKKTIAIVLALLHDVVEDADYTLEDIGRLFGGEVAYLLAYLTDPPKSAGNRKFRKGLVVEKLKFAPDIVKLVKIADVIDNLSDVENADEKFLKLYVPEKDALFKGLAANTEASLVLKPALAELKEKIEAAKAIAEAKLKGEA